MAQRSDAQQNREHILRIAHEAFAEDGAVSLNSIAKRAGIGAGTLYRHFPTREALILAVYRHDVQRLVDSVSDVLAKNPPLQAFRVWFQTLADYVRLKHGLPPIAAALAIATIALASTAQASRHCLDQAEAAARGQPARLSRTATDAGPTTAGRRALRSRS